MLLTKDIKKLTEISQHATIVLGWDDASAIKAEYDLRQLVQIWNEESETVEVTTTITRAISYDLYRAQTGYLKDMDFDADPDVESFLIKDEHDRVLTCDA